MTAEPPSSATVSLSRRQLLILEELVASLLPRMGEDEEQRRRVTELLANRIVSAPAAVRCDLERALRALGSPAVNLLVLGRPVPLHRLGTSRRARALQRWSTSWLPPARAAFHALRRLVLSTWYATGDARRELGWLPPLHLRAPALPWEGPLPGEQSDAEPVARWEKSQERVPGAQPERRPTPQGVVDVARLGVELTLRTEVVIVGSGAGGSLAAARLAEAGREVVILEEGDYLTAPDFNEDEGALMPRLYADQALRTTRDGSVVLLQGRGVGGGTVVNWMLMLRTPPDVLEEWRKKHGLSNLSPDVLDPVFDRIEQEVHARLVPDEAHSPANLALLRGAEALGWRASRARINAKGCVRAGTCSLGCRYEAKQSALLTYLPRALAAGARLYPSTEVQRIEIVGRSLAGQPALKRVHGWVRRPGAAPLKLVAEAPVVILAGGAVATPAILERSGLGGGGVGRYLRLHPTTAVLGRYQREMYPLAGIPQSVVLDHFLHRDSHGHGFWIESPALLPGLAAAALGSFGAEHSDAMHLLSRSAAFIVLVRDGSASSSSQGAVWVDRHGHVRVRYRMSGADLDNLKAGIEAAARLHLAAGAEEVVTLHTPALRLASGSDLSRLRRASCQPNRVSLFSAHVNGTCRMGVVPATSGVNAEGQRHGVPGLYVADGSLLPSAPGVNPQETIMALASLVAEGIAARG